MADSGARGQTTPKHILTIGEHGWALQHPSDGGVLCGLPWIPCPAVEYVSRAGELIIEMLEPGTFEIWPMNDSIGSWRIEDPEDRDVDVIIRARERKTQ